ncbi:carbon storage regulator CsrA [Pseudomonas caspiana]|uniref:carbon storage regulator CsrA n=1 Tax=Pseudomonas caspiana TaxID=1451454 RepID=UPI0032EE4F83
MLVIMRDIGEVFSIGDEVTVQILAINGNQIRLGIEAPKDVKVHRAEVYKRIAQRNSQQAAKAGPQVPDTDS